MIPYLFFFPWGLTFSLSFATFHIHKALPRCSNMERMKLGIISVTLPESIESVAWSLLYRLSVAESPGLSVTDAATDAESLGMGPSYCTLKKEKLRKSRSCPVFKMEHQTFILSLKHLWLSILHQIFFQYMKKKSTSFHFISIPSPPPTDLTDSLKKPEAILWMKIAPILIYFYG